ncbi:hypothetical protein BOTBODRAFT_375199 [Botryobasidium botryosum FD-172 SS1]|uniref:Glutamine amidotransferase type-2 domain-containing protein n=1 Tax=Botryobasidium botryosum (strain FD-172 SS1) TaxID=930990 RepID=A0A067N7H8_BOTB1|nr:hypothetical protein BOTBODRAFT_375199 [Botryobasidium botryosum FD-172 SS1]
MCGILCSFALHPGDQDETYSTLIARLREANQLRGPDSNKSHLVAVGQSTPSDHLLVSFYASVLHLRGDHVVPQPHIGEGGNILCWNGEIFDGIDVAPEQNDGALLFSLLQSTDSNRVPDVLKRVEGPYAFIYYHRHSNRLFFGRDPLGRRSLLIHKPTPDLPCFILTSVSAPIVTEGHGGRFKFEEVPAENLSSLDVDNVSSLELASFDSKLQSVARSSAGSALEFVTPERINRDTPPPDHPLPWEIPSSVVDEFIDQLERSVILRVRDIPKPPMPTTSASTPPSRVAVLFSGGIDCTILAFLAHRHVPLEEPIDLLNVAFENPRSLAAQKTTKPAPKKAKGKKKIGKDAPGQDINEQEHKVSEHGDRDKGDEVPSRDGDPTYMVPDRVTGLEEVEELRRLCPGRTWNFVHIDVTYEESTRERPKIEALMYPSRTIMDLSLSLALYFASRGIGSLRPTLTAPPQPYTSPARVLLSGLGSDELLGGYARHRHAFQRAGWEGLIDELQLDLTRLPTRNLGRDDRVISSNAKETRYPFLSLSLVAHLARLPVHLKLDPRVPEGTGDKALLRLAAARLGLEGAAGRKKRAMQFGSRSARMEGGAETRRGDNVLAV